MRQDPRSLSHFPSLRLFLPFSFSSRAVSRYLAADRGGKNTHFYTVKMCYLARAARDSPVVPFPPSSPFPSFNPPASPFLGVARAPVHTRARTPPGAELTRRRRYPPPSSFSSFPLSLRSQAHSHRHPPGRHLYCLPLVWGRKKKGTDVLRAHVRVSRSSPSALTPATFAADSSAAKTRVVPANV